MHPSQVPLNKRVSDLISSFKFEEAVGLLESSSLTQGAYPTCRHLLISCIEKSQVACALRLFNHLMGTRIKLDSNEIKLLIQKLLFDGLVEEALVVMEQSHKQGMNIDERLIESAVKTASERDMFCRCVQLLELLLSARARLSGTTWNVIVDGFLAQKDFEDCFRFLQLCSKAATDVDSIPWNRFIEACVADCRFELGYGSVRWLEQNTNKGQGPRWRLLMESLIRLQHCRQALDLLQQLLSAPEKPVDSQGSVDEAVTKDLVALCVRQSEVPALTSLFVNLRPSAVPVSLQAAAISTLIKLNSMEAAVDLLSAFLDPAANCATPSNGTSSTSSLPSSSSAATSFATSRSFSSSSLKPSSSSASSSAPVPLHQLFTAHELAALLKSEHARRLSAEKMLGSLEPQPLSQPPATSPSVFEVTTHPTSSAASHPFATAPAASAPSLASPAQPTASVNPFSTPSEMPLAPSSPLASPPPVNAPSHPPPSARLVSASASDEEDFVML
eukprot:GILI01005724.1.p1 GENE.GILI01005724.1~~GILI01005724.1.p1  ORF type:complete len:502 (+),score=144.85 GILI01005724.1:107-1612(+)